VGTDQADGGEAGAAEGEGLMPRWTRWLLNLLRRLSEDDCSNCDAIECGLPSNHSSTFPALTLYRAYCYGQITADEWRSADTRPILTCSRCGRERRRA
jgi:hypothetical protein